MTTCTTCPYCGVGCGVLARVRDNRLHEVSGDSAHPANAGRLCVKGTHLPAASGLSGRLLHPRVDGRQTSWQQALDAVADGFRHTLQQYGSGSVGFYLSGQLLTEDYYVANKLMKGFLGSANVDTNSRLCMASAVAAHKRAFGEDVVPCDYADVESCNLLVLAGSNAAWTHPVLYQRAAAARQQGNMRVVVIDPRRTPTCDLADLHLPLLPGSDTVLFNGLLTYLAEQQAVDREYISAHTEGFAQTLQQVRTGITQVAAVTGLPAARILQFYRWFARCDRTVTLFSQGVNQSAAGTDKANAIINCHLATGRISRAGCGPFSITGQPNAMGGREVGGMASQLAAHMDFTPADIAAVSRFWSAANMATSPGLTAVDLFAAAAAGEIKALWIMGTNPAVSLPRSAHIREALRHCPLVVVSDCVQHTDTNSLARILLPARGWGEKDGTVTNSERCVSRQRRLLEAPGEARPDWWMVSEVARRLGFARQFAYAGPAQIFREHAALTGVNNNGRRQLDLSAWQHLDDGEYDNLKPRQWPPARPFADGCFSTASGCARFVPTPHKPPVQQPDPAHPLILNTGRLRDQWHTMTRTGTAPELFNHDALPRLQIHPRDAAARQITGDSLVRLHNQLGSVCMLAALTDDVAPGQVFAPIHWNDQFARQANVSQLVQAVVDPHSGQPESKHAAVEVTALHCRCWARMVTVSPLSRARLQAVPGVQFWAVQPVADGWCYEVALQAVEALLGTLPGPPAAAFEAGLQRRYAGGAGAGSWLLYSAARRQQLPAARRLAGQMHAGGAAWQKLTTGSPRQSDLSPLICSCFEVSEASIKAAIAAGAGSVQALGEVLQCGTNCGSCVPELNSLLAAAAPRPAAVAEAAGS